MSSDRLHQIKDSLNRLGEQLGGKQKAKDLAPLEEKVRIDQQIKEIRWDICQLNQEYFQILGERSTELVIEESEAEPIIAEFVEQVGKLEVRQTAPYPDEIMQILREILDKVNQPGTTAAAQLKAVISSMPPFISLSYEAGLDTENFLRQYFPKFSKWVQAFTKKS
ncbi:hypothetical protein [Aulosira sp. FACHB-615]|uniref:hypothetical protein n=1 Tax=Aulosira sp. FACHB-615 TaxID=2692777 RepID=UPI001686C9E7|nr:hypothetical protein [Aulosira sp. FACHB-615]MBD2492320.1 hypothetical protein [Aulosira sp. FACHB-615]